MTQLFANNAAAALAGAIASGATSLTLQTGQGARFPTPAGGDFFLLTLFQLAGAVESNHEIVKCTARAGDVLTVLRAQEGTTARAFASADPAELRLTAGALAAKQDVGGAVTVSSTAPSAPVNGQGWVSLESGIEWTWLDDGVGAGQWVEAGPGTNGTNGTSGTNGTNGTSATVAVGTVTALASTAAPTVANAGTSAAAVLNFGIPTPLLQPVAAVLTNNNATGTETIVARFALPANYLTSDSFLRLAFMGQVSSNGTLSFKVRVGTLGTTADALAGTFATSAAGAANAFVAGDVLLHLPTSTTIYAGGFVQLVNASLGRVTAAQAVATIAPASALFVSLTLVQSVTQTYTSHSAVLEKLR